MVYFHDPEGKPYPCDPADLNRCRKLLLAVPEIAPHLSYMVDEGPEWKLYVEHWDELIKLLEQELPSGIAPKCFDLMQKLRSEAEAACKTS